MSASANKRLMQDAFAGLATANSAPFLALLAEDINWTIIGSASWSGTYRGKHDVITRLLQPFFAKFETPYRNTAHRFIAEDDFVVIEARGSGRTSDKMEYDQTYCLVCRLAEGKLKEVKEYLDTDLGIRAVGDL